MRCMQCDRVIAAHSDGICSVCELEDERELGEWLGDTPAERWQVGDKTVEVKGLLPRMPLDDTCAERPDKPVADSVLYAPDAQKEFTIRHGGGA